MISKEIYDKIKLIEIKTRQLVNNIFSGEYHSAFKGTGMEFAEVREYLPGDDVRSIDWNVTARTGIPHIKKFDEEREVNVIFLVDLSKSIYFGTDEKLKREIAGEIATILAFSATRNNDKVGLLVFTDEVELFVPPAKTKKHIFRIIRDILEFHPKGSKTDIAGALKFLNKTQKKRSIVFLLSDFILNKKDETIDFETDLRIIRKKHDIVNIVLNDKTELALPKGDYRLLENRETGEKMWVRFSKKEMDRFLENQKAYKEMLYSTFKKNKVDYVEIDVSQSYVSPLVKFFKSRERRMH